MSKIKSFNELKDFADKLKPILYMRENHTKENPEKREILVCGGTGCTSSDSIQIIENLRTEMHAALDNVNNKDIITFHEAFPYFAEEFNLNIAGVIEVEPDSEPSAKEVENIISIINEKNIKALFTEPQYSSKIADTIAKETGASIYTLDPIVTGDANEDAYDDYIVKMQENLNTLKEALK